MRTSDRNQQPTEWKAPSPGRIALAIAGPGTILVGALVLVLGTHGQTAPAAAGVPLASPAHDMAEMPGMGHTATTAATPAPTAKAPAMVMTPTGNRKEPYGTHPLGYTVDHGVKVFHLTAAPVRWRIDSHTVVNAWAYNGQVPGPVIRL